MSGYLVKLVRDGIPRLLAQSSDEKADIDYRPMSREDHVRRLRGKLVEEAVEYLTDPSIEELGDVLAVVRALAIVDLECGYPALQSEEMRKHQERGGFQDGIGMYATHPSDLVKWEDSGRMTAMDEALQREQEAAATYGDRYLMVVVFTPKSGVGSVVMPIRSTTDKAEAERRARILLPTFSGVAEEEYDAKVASITDVTL